MIERKICELRLGNMLHNIRADCVKTDFMRFANISEAFQAIGSGKWHGSTDLAIYEAYYETRGVYE